MASWFRKRQSPVSRVEETTFDETADTSLVFEGIETDVKSDVATVTINDVDEDILVSNMATTEDPAVTEDPAANTANRNSALTPRQQLDHHRSTVPFLREQLNSAPTPLPPPPPPKHRDVDMDNRMLKKHNIDLQSQLKEASVERRRLKNIIDDQRQEYRELRGKHEREARKYDMKVQEYDQMFQEYGKTVQEYDKYDKTVREYRDLDEKYMAVVRALRVTDDDHTTIHRKLTDMMSLIEDLVTTAKGQGSVNLNRDAAMQLFRESPQGFRVPEQELESFHLNYRIEAAVALTVINRLFCAPLQSIFDLGVEFEAICHWVESQ
ncbi:hypothetical protein BGZ83_000134, partial [Gryganskiella cystojenkinii]